ncbi:MAG TPA: DEAD/DEAH box helicase [Dermatophilaceae bacterium]|jgi:superfamily II DNA or RNA helicase|nr:DEAD/DEAH box helicase [Dermatophilaceae bacterium]
MAHGAPTPPWVARLDDDRLRHELGPATYDRGDAYYRSDMVLSVATGRNDEVLLGTVRGSHGRTYQTVVRVADPRPSPSSGFAEAWSSRCTCPMGSDCKHVVALVLTARQRLASGHPRVRPTWESALADLVRDPPDEGATIPLGFQFEVVSPPSSRYAGSSAPSPRLRIRPVTTGRNGGWVRGGVSWRELEYGFGARPGAAERDIALAILAAARARRGYYTTEQQVYLDDLGRRAWHLLHDARQTGIQLVGVGKQAPEVELCQEPAMVALDARRRPDGSGLSIEATLRVPGHPDLALGGSQDEVVGLVGEPPHGVFVGSDCGLVLARLEPVLDATMARLVRGGALQVPADDLPRFFAVYYPALRQRATLRSSDDSVSFPVVEPPRLGLTVRFEQPGHRCRLRWSFAYAVGDDVVRVPIVGRSEGVARDAAAEATLLTSLALLDAVPGLRVRVGGSLRLVPETLLGGLATAIFASEVLPRLEERDDVLLTVEGTPLDYAQVDEAPQIEVSTNEVGEDGRNDWFDLDITVTVGGEDVPFGPLFAALARGETHLVLDSGTWFSLERPELHALRRLIEEARSLQDRESKGLRLTRWHAGLWEELVELGVVTHQSERWSRTVGALLDLTSIPAPEPPSGLEATLRDYQLDGFHWLAFLWDHELGGILADDMGLGKTLQTLAMAARALERGTLTHEAPLLVVAPTSVVSTWVREAARFCPDLRVAAVRETARKRGQPLETVIDGAHVVVTSFALLRLDEDAYCRRSWSGLVLDEAQFVKNHQAKTYQVARRLPAPFKLAITGTPLENSLMDLWALLSIVAPGLFPSPQRFTELFRRPIESGQAPELLATLRRRIRPLMLRRTKEFVARDLPPKVELVLEVSLNPQHRRVYQTRLQRERQRVLGMLDDVNRNRIAILRSLTVLRQLSLDVSLVDDSLAGKVRSSKIDALIETLGEVLAEGHRALVFSQFTGFLKLVRARLDAEGIGHVYLDGRTRNRPARIAEFTDGDAPVFLISLKAGGAGLTLIEADYVFVLDPWWNPATEAQAVDRTHRIGQDKTVMVYRLVAEGTIEEKVVALQERKRDLFARVVEADGLLGAPLGADDIRGLLEP